MNQLKAAVLAAGFVLGYAGSAAANEEAGFYAGVGVGQSTIENDDDFIDFDEDDTGFKIFGGYQFNQYFSVELAYVDGGDPSASATADIDVDLGDGTIVTVPDADVDIEAEATQVNLSAIGTYAFNDVFGVMGRLGVSYVDAEVRLRASFLGTPFAFQDADDSTTDLSYGLGLWFAPTQNLRLRLEYEMTSAGLDDLSDEDTDISLISLSAAYRFGR